MDKAAGMQLSIKQILLRVMTQAFQILPWKLLQSMMLRYSGKSAIIVSPKGGVFAELMRLNVFKLSGYGRDAGDLCSFSGHASIK